MALPPPLLSPQPPTLHPHSPLHSNFKALLKVTSPGRPPRPSIISNCTPCRNFVAPRPPSLLYLFPPAPRGPGHSVHRCVGLPAQAPQVFLKPSRTQGSAGLSPAPGDGGQPTPHPHPTPRRWLRPSLSKLQSKHFTSPRQDSQEALWCQEFQPKVLLDLRATAGWAPASQHPRVSLLCVRNTEKPRAVHPDTCSQPPPARSEYRGSGCGHLHI